MTTPVSLNRDARHLWRPAGEISWRGIHQSVSGWSRTPGWAAIEREIYNRFGGFPGLRTLELGCGIGKISLLMALKGAHTTLLDYNQAALDQARRLRVETGLAAVYVEADLLHLPETVTRRFDVAMSFGTAEHFLGEERQAVFEAHSAALRPGGLAIIWVPNRWGVFYRLVHGLQVASGRWPEDLPEVPFTRTDLLARARQAGLHTVYVVGGETLAADFRTFILGNLKAILWKAMGRPRACPGDGSAPPPSREDWRRLADLPMTKMNAGLLARHFSYPLVLFGLK